MTLRAFEEEVFHSFILRETLWACWWRNLPDRPSCAGLESIFALVPSYVYNLTKIFEYMVRALFKKEIPWPIIQIGHWALITHHTYGDYFALLHRWRKDATKKPDMQSHFSGAVGTE